METSVEAADARPVAAEAGHFGGTIGLAADAVAGASRGPEGAAAVGDGRKRRVKQVSIVIRQKNRLRCGILIFFLPALGTVGTYIPVQARFFLFSHMGFFILRKNK